MWRSIIEEVEQLDTGRAALRRFGLVVGGVFLAISVGLLLLGRGASAWVLGTGAVGTLLVAGGALIPQHLATVYRYWMTIAFVLGFIMTRVLLGIVFGLLVVPIGLTMRLLGKDLLRLRPGPPDGTYWLPRVPNAPLSERLRRLY